MGELVGAAVYAEAYSLLAKTLQPIGNLGKITFADAAHVSLWWFIAALAAGAVGLLFWLEKRERHGTVGRQL